MAKKGKMKISKVKRNNQTTNKMKKQGKLKLQRHRNKVQKQRGAEQPRVEYSSESEASGDEWADMLDEDEQRYLAARLATQPQLLSHVPAEEPTTTKSRKRKRESKEKPPKRTVVASDSGAESEGSVSDVEEKYEKEMAERPVKKLRPLLPIKTKMGLQERTEEVEDSESEQEGDTTTADIQQIGGEDDSASDSGVDGSAEDPEAEDSKEVTTVELLAARRDRLAHDKLRIGALCSSLLECPEKKLKNLYPILYLMEERLKDETLNLHSVRKLATLSACEVFKDILPEYQLRHQDYSNVKLKKDTLSLYKYEKELLEFYKRYLQRLEKAAAVLRKKKGDTRKVEDSCVELALVSLQCMCGLLCARPQFNYATNIAQSVVPFLGCKDQRARDAVTRCCTQVFAEDTRGEITLTIVRLINQLVKRRGDSVHPSALDCLLTLKIRDIDMDAESELKHKKKQDEKHKKRIVNLSKKEKKRAKKLKEVERELLETQAQESEMARKKQLTEVTRTVFHIYFRLLKSAPGSKLLTAALDGLAKFTHVINLEYYSDLVSILKALLSSEAVDGRSRLLAARTVLAILAAVDLNVDPACFHAYLYHHALDVHAGKTLDCAKVVIEAASMICTRARRVSPAVLCAFAKRLLTMALQLPHHGALACLAIVLQLAQQSKAVSSLVEVEGEFASGRYDPHSPSPEHCHAVCAVLHEVRALTAHYHPVVREAAHALAALRTHPALHKLSPIQIFEQYDGSLMSFKPAIPPPKKGVVAKPKPHHTWSQPSLQQYCETIHDQLDMTLQFR